MDAAQEIEQTQVRRADDFSCAPIYTAKLLRACHAHALILLCRLMLRQVSRCAADQRESLLLVARLDHLSLLYRTKLYIVARTYSHALTSSGRLLHARHDGHPGQARRERRITVPLYASAACINCFNSVQLMLGPTLPNAFLLWGSMNVFVWVRIQLLAFAFAKIDWSLAYSYSI